MAEIIVTSVHHELYYSLRREVVPVCDIKIEYWTHAEDEDDELATDVTMTFFGHSIGLFFIHAIQETRTAVETQRLLREAVVSLRIENATIEEGRGVVSEYDVTVRFKTARHLVIEPDFRSTVARFATELGHRIDALVKQREEVSPSP